MKNKIDWQIVAKESGWKGHSCGREDAKKAIELLLGAENIRAAVDDYISFKPHFELIRNILWYLQPPIAMDYCYDLFKNSKDLETRIYAVELLRVVADKRVVKWIPEFLNDANPAIQNWGIGVLDQLLWSSLVEFDEVKVLLKKSTTHKNEAVRENVDFIIKYLRKRGFKISITRPKKKATSR